MEKCSICWREIRDDETPYVYADQVACAECYADVAGTDDETELDERDLIGNPTATGEQVACVILNLNDYELTIDGRSLSVDGPDEDIATQIGRRFLQNIQVATALMLQSRSKDEYTRNLAFEGLGQLLGVPPSQ
jgi:hypothetical protein